MVTKGILNTVLVVCVLGVTGCGGGGSEGDNSNNNAILVNAGPDISVLEQTEVTLSGTVQSSDENLTYRWQVAPALAITQADNTSPQATFMAPTVMNAQQYTFTLTVTGAQGGTGEDTLIVQVNPDNLLPVPSIIAPTFTNAEVGFIPAGETVVLDGSMSSDDDAPDPSQQIAVWEWQQTAGEAVLIGQPTNLPQLSFTAPITAERQTLEFSLTVSDAEGGMSTEALALTILAESETPPVISAGIDQFLFSGERIVLAGVASTSVPDALPFDVLWDSAELVTISNSSSLDTFAVAPNVSAPTDVELSLTVVDQFGNRVTQAIDVNVRPVPIPVMNDTGVVFQGDATNVTTTQQNAFPGQDAQLGLDRMSLSNTIEKAGQGQAGFDFTALNANGDEMDDLSSTWGCVRDNTTGFVWEVKTEDGGIHDTDATYTWFQSEDNGGFVGDQLGTGASCSIANCNTEAFVMAVNAVGLCGFFDWRLPNHDELMSIVNFGSVPGPKIDDAYFPFVGDVGGSALWYWSNQPGADGVSDTGAQNAWAIDFNSGVDNFLNKSTPARVRLVRAGR